MYLAPKESALVLGQKGRHSGAVSDFAVYGMNEFPRGFRPHQDNVVTKWEWTQDPAQIGRGR